MRAARKRSGEVAEAGFQHQALAHGLSVAEPYGDLDPFDFLAGKGRRFSRVQVKSTGTAPIGKVYRVNSNHRNPAGRKAARKSIPYTVREVDFIAAYLGPENSWYIIPIALAEGKGSLSIHATDHPKRGRWVPYLEAWHLLRDGVAEVVQDSAASAADAISVAEEECEVKSAVDSGGRCSNCRLVHAFLSVLGK